MSSLFSGSQCALLTKLLCFPFTSLFDPSPLLWLGHAWRVWFVGGCADTSDPSPVIGRWPLSWHSTTNRTPPSTHADVVKMPQIPPNPPWSRRYADAHLTSFALGAVCGRPKWRSRAPAQTLPLKTWKICRPWTPSAPEASVCPSMRCAGRAFLVTSKLNRFISLLFLFCMQGRWVGLGHSGRGVVLAMRGGRGHLVWDNSDWAGKSACWRRVLSFSFVSLVVMLTACAEPCEWLTGEHLFWF